MPRLHINGEACEVKDCSVAAALEAAAVPRENWKAVAIARNGGVVPRAAWQETSFAEGDRIEIVQPFAGG